MVQKDSIHFKDTLKYYTTGGRLVHGGGGIMPDFFVPADTTGVNEFYTSIVSKNLIYYFAFDYADQNRSALKSMKTADEIENYLNQKNVFDLFLTHIKKSGIKYSNNELAESKELVKSQLFAYIARNTIGDGGFYPIIYKIDPTVKKAIDLLQKNWDSKEIAAIENKKN